MVIKTFLRSFWEILLTVSKHTQQGYKHQSKLTKDEHETGHHQEEEKIRKCCWHFYLNGELYFLNIFKITSNLDLH